MVTSQPLFGTQTQIGNSLNTNPLNAQPLSLQASPLNLTTQSFQGASQTTHTFTVTNTNDSGAGSFRQAILDANADSAQKTSVADVINFNLGAGTHFITLTSANLDITAKNLTINGTGANNLFVSGGNKLQDFKIEAGATVTLSGLSIIQGSADNGGGILNNGTLTLNNDSLTNNTTTGSGGAINNNGVLTINNSLFDHNVAANGGAISSGNQLTINGSTFTNNSTPQEGGAIIIGGTGTIKNSLFSSNTGGNGGGIFNFGKLTVDGSTFNSNSSPIGGAIVNVGSAILAVTNSTFFNNTAGGGTGGGIENNNTSQLTVTNSTFIGNTAGQGAAIFNDNAHGATLNGSGFFFSGNTSSRAAGTAIDNNDISGVFQNLTVDSLVDTTDNNFSAGHISLREAILATAAGGTINFASDLAGGTITLTQGALTIDHNLTINGLGANQLSISGDNKVEDFYVTSGANVTISGLTITKGLAANGGGILNNGTLTLTKDNFTNNTAQGFGGAVNNNGVLMITSSTFDHNTAAGGGAIGSGNQLTINGSTFTNNTGVVEGGAIDSSGTFTINGSTFTNNTAPNGGAIFTIGSGSVSGSTFTNNTAQIGGAINNAGTLTLTNDTISGNKALNANGVGGGIWNNGTLTLEGDTITGNSAGFEGGGVFNTAGHTVTVHNTKIKTNTALVAPDVFGSFTSQGGNTIGILDETATGFVNGQNGDTVQKIQAAPKMESYNFVYNYTAAPIVNGGPTPQDYLGTGFAPVGTYTTGQTIKILDTFGRPVGTYTIGSVNNNVILNPNQLNQVKVVEYDFNLAGGPVVTRLIAGTGLDPASGGTNGLGSEQGIVIGRGAFGSNVLFNNQNEAIHQIHF